MSNSRKVADAVTSACTSSAIQMYYSNKLRHSEDVTYYTTVIAIWSGPEIASGILAFCLPASPKFFQSLKESSLWSGLKSFVQSCLRPKTEAKSVFVTGYDEQRNEQHKAAKGYDSLSSFNAWFKKYNVLSDENGLVSTSKNDSRNRSTRNEHSMEKCSNQIIRTTHIMTTSEFSTASTSNPGNEACNQ